MSILYIVGTPIGNLGDITIRAIDILKSVDLILCEDTRVTKILLEHYRIKAPVLSYHQHSKLKKEEYFIQLLKEGKNLALVSDAGTPGISDPGNQLVSRLAGEFAAGELSITPVPGPNALIAAASVSGLPMDRFVFMGFPPVKKKRKQFFQEAVNSKYQVVFYESPYRILKTLKELETINQDLEIVLFRELTKKFENIYRGKIKTVIERLEQGEIRGEFTVIINNKKGVLAP